MYPIIILFVFAAVILFGGIYLIVKHGFGIDD